MVRVTKRGIDKELNKLLLNSLLKKFKNCKTIEDLAKILNSLFTPEEQIMFKKRLAIMLFIKTGKRVKDIRQTLDVSKATIIFVRKELKKSPKKVVEKESKIKKSDLREIKNDSWYPAYTGKGRWSFLNR